MPHCVLSVRKAECARLYVSMRFSADQHLVCRISHPDRQATPPARGRGATRANGQLLPLNGRRRYRFTPGVTRDTQGGLDALFLQ